MSGISRPAVIEDPTDGVFVCRYTKCGQPHDGSFGHKTRGMYCDAHCQRLGCAERRRVSWKKATEQEPNQPAPLLPTGCAVRIRVHDQVLSSGVVAKRQIVAEFDNSNTAQKMHTLQSTQNERWMQYMQNIVAQNLAVPSLTTG